LPIHVDRWRANRPVVTTVLGFVLMRPGTSAVVLGTCSRNVDIGAQLHEGVFE
jgi:hypothetical protein